MSKVAASPERPLAAAVPAVDASFFGHPRGLSILFFAELWERFSYYGMRAILLLFMVAAIPDGGLGFPIKKASLVYGTYASLVYLMSLPGGWLADKFLGLRKAVFAGGSLILCGHACLALPFSGGFYAGLAFVILGTGLLKPNISALVGELYPPDDARRDAGFSIYYMGINLGAFLSPLAVGWLAQSDSFKGSLEGIGLSARNSWHFGFGAAAVGMLLGLIWYVAGWKHLGDAGLHPVRPETPAAAVRQRRILQAGLGVVAGAVLLVWLLARSGAIVITAENVSSTFGYVLALTPLVLFPSLYFFGGFDRAEKKRLIVIMALFFGAAVFWSVFEQAGSTLTLFADRNTHSVITWPLIAVVSAVLLAPVYLALAWYRGLPPGPSGRRRPGALAFALLVAVSAAVAIGHLARHQGQAFPSSFFQSANALFIVALAPLFAALWVGLAHRQPSSPAKFTIGLLFAALGFAALMMGANLSDAGARVSPLWLLSAYMLHTVGELCLSPVGLSAMSKLAPRRIVGLVLGIWFLAVSLGNFLAGFAASFYESMPLPNLFVAVTGVALAATVIMALTVRPIRAMLGRD